MSGSRPQLLFKDEPCGTFIIRIKPPSRDPGRCCQVRCLSPVRQRCPVKFCNNASAEVVEINRDLCIGCGNCIDACTHGARIGLDDFAPFQDAIARKLPMVAIVAHEVKNLAAQTEAATAEIRSQIDAIQAATKDAVVDINTVSEVIRQVGQLVAANATAIEEQSVVTRQIADTISASLESVAMSTTLCRKPLQTAPRRQRRAYCL